MHSKLSIFFLALALVSSGGASALPEAQVTRLIAVGGGERPAAAMARFVEWAGGTSARIVVVTWATAYPTYSFNDLQEDLAQYHPAQIIAAPSPTPAMAYSPAQQWIPEWATGVFFSGGDQNNIMAVLTAHPEIADYLRSRYRYGLVVGGTSAGTSVLSQVMMTGNGDVSGIGWDPKLTAPGLGLVPDVILDQHFLFRERENRLFSVVANYPEKVGMGIDQDGALAITGNQMAEVLGPKQVMAVTERAEHEYLVTLLQPGDHYDLVARRKIATHP